MFPIVDPEFLADSPPSGRVLFLELSHADRFRPRWYKVDPETDLILRGFERFYSLEDRLRDHKDLATVEKGLMDLAAYLYTEIPEVADDVPEAADSGTASLRSFAEHMSALPAYVPERAVAETGRLRHGLTVAAGRVNALFCHPNALVSFAAWYVLMLALFLAGFWVALRFMPAVRVDSTVVTAVVGGPVATAITAVTVPRLVSARKSDQ